MKIIIVSILLLSSFYLFAEVESFSEVSYQVHSNNQAGNEFKSGINLYEDFTYKVSDNFNLSMKNNLFYVKEYEGDRLSGFKNRAELGFAGNFHKHVIQLNYINYYFGSEETESLHLLDLAGSQRKKMENHFDFIYSYKSEKTEIYFYNKLKGLNFYSKSTEEKYNGEDYSDFSYISIERYFTNNFSLNLRVNENFDFNERNEYVFSEYAIGFSFYKKLDFFNIFKFNHYFFLNEEDFSRKYFQTNFRYLKRVGTDFSGFLQLQNLSYLEEDSDGFISTNSFIKLKGKYNLKSGTYDNSYIFMGLNHCFEKDNLTFSTGMNYNLYENFFLNSKIEILLDSFTRIENQIDYYFSFKKSLWIKHNFNKINHEFEEHTIFLGSSFYL